MRRSSTGLSGSYFVVLRSVDPLVATWPADYDAPALPAQDLNDEGTSPVVNIAYHLVAEEWLDSRPENAGYFPEAFEADGFVHLTHGLDEVLAVGNAFYLDDRRAYLLLTIDLDRLNPATGVRYDDPARQYPHVFGPLDRAAIVAVQRVERAGGQFIGVADR